MNCPHCNREVRGTFCTGCGARLNPDGTDAGQIPLGAQAPADPDATSVIHHDDLKAFLANAVTPEQEHVAPAAGSSWQSAPAIPPSDSGWQATPATGYAPPPSYDSSGDYRTATLAPITTTTYASASTYPAGVVFDVPPTSSRLFAIPVVGFMARMVMLIPHFIVLYVVGLGAALAQLVIWFPVLTTGQYPEWAFNFNTGILRWATNVNAYAYGLTDQYPPFGFADPGPNYPVHVIFESPDSSSRLFAVPILGYLIKLVMLIPHLVAIYVLGIITGLIYLVAWIPVLTSGRYPDWGYSFIGGYLRWTVRLGAFFLGLTDKYPPFQLGN